MHIDIDKILEDTCYKLPKGYPTIVNGVFTERDEVLIINEVLEAKGLPTLPLSPISQIKKPIQYTSGFKTNTGTKEGMVMYFATQADEVLQLVVEKLDVNYSMSLKLPTNEIKTDKYDGSPKAAADTIHNIQLLNKSKLPFNKKDKEAYHNAVSSARWIVQNIGILDPAQADRGTTFTIIRAKAKELLATGDIKVEPDKWNPGDIYVYGGSIPTGIEEIKQLKAGDNSLNALFMDTLKYPDDGKILAISLKEGEARGGKATSFREILTKDENYPNVQDLSPVLDKLKDVNDENQATISIYVYKVIGNYGNVFKTNYFTENSVVTDSLVKLVNTDNTSTTPTYTAKVSSISEAYKEIRDKIFLIHDKGYTELKGLDEQQLTFQGEVHPFFFRPTSNFKNLSLSTQDEKDNRQTILNSVNVLRIGPSSGLIWSTTRAKAESKPITSIEEVIKIDPNSPEQTFGAVLSDKFFLLSTDLGTNESNNPVPFTDLNSYELTQQDYIKRIEPATYATVRGENLLKVLNAIIKVLFSHVHNPAMDIENQFAYKDGNSLKLLRETLENDILNKSIRIN